MQNRSSDQQATDLQRAFMRSADELSAEAQRVVNGTIVQAEQVRTAAQAALDKTLNRKALSDHAKRAAAAATYRRQQATQQELYEQHIAGIKAHKQKLAARAFGSDKPLDPQTAMSVRHARAQAASLQDPREAETLIRDAMFTGDTHLARAAAAVAFENGWFDAVDVWGAQNQDAIRHLVELRSMPDTNDFAWRASTGGQFMTPKPDILEGLREHEIDALAADPTLDGDAA